MRTRELVNYEVNWKDRGGKGEPLAMVGRYSLSDNHKSPVAGREALRRAPILDQLSDEDLDQILHFVHWKKHPQGAEIVSYKGPGSEVYFLVEGRIRVTNNEADQKKRLVIVREVVFSWVFALVIINLILIIWF